LLRANPAQPPKSGKGGPAVRTSAPADRARRPSAPGGNGANPAARKNFGARRSQNSNSRQSAFAEELAKVL
jgi:hypothetical protein